jgi:hypothetical protein
MSLILYKDEVLLDSLYNVGTPFIGTNCQLQAVRRFD